jgi:hypothetical protein
MKRAEKYAKRIEKRRARSSESDPSGHRSFDRSEPSTWLIWMLTAGTALRLVKRWTGLATSSGGQRIDLPVSAVWAT